MLQYLSSIVWWNNGTYSMVYLLSCVFLQLVAALWKHEITCKLKSIFGYSSCPTFANCRSPPQPWRSEMLLTVITISPERLKLHVALSILSTHHCLPNLLSILGNVEFYRSTLCNLHNNTMPGTAKFQIHSNLETQSYTQQTQSKCQKMQDGIW